MSSDEDPDQPADPDTPHLEEIEVIHHDLKAMHLDDNLTTTSSMDLENELYHFNTDYLQTLNTIRRAFNLKEIPQRVETSENIDLHYTPPTKKQCLEQEEPSEQSSPVTKPVVFKPPSDFPEDFVMLNVPVTQTRVHINPSVTVVEDAGGDDSLGGDDLSVVSRAYVDPLMPTGLDMPRLSTQLYNFPSVVNLAKWVKVQEDETDFSSMFMQKSLPKRRLLEVGTVRSLNSMARSKNESPKKKEVKVVEPSDDEDLEEEEKTKKCNCRCFSICFSKRRPRFFS